MTQAVTPVVRRALPSEAAAVATLAARTFTSAFGADNRPEDLHQHLADHCSAAALARQLSDPDWSTLVAAQGDTLLGYSQLCTGEAPPCVALNAGRQIYRFYVDPAWIGHGLAGILMAASLEEIRARGVRFAWLTTWDRNARALAFYRKCGFVERGTTTFAVGQDVQRDLVLGLTL